MSIQRSIEALERSVGTKPRRDSEERKRLNKELKARWPEAEKMAREEAAGNFTRRMALEELEARVRERIRVRCL